MKTTEPRCTVRYVLALCAAALLWSPASTAEKPDAVTTCANCHGEDGLSDDSTIPIIAGASAFFLENQLFIYKEEARPCAADEFKDTAEVEVESHCALATGLSEDEIIALAGYYSEQPFQPADQPVDQALADEGASIHNRSCDKCHTEGGGLALDDAGILAGQWKPYLIEQMELFKAGERWQPEKMQPEMEELSAADIKALAEYYASQAQ